ncbi:hypothetical protein G7Z17_g2179 [Cylindrodendrum hubeiense]|uniref:Uncharacterized protein n=1 Tax=Cylindrodendrum hubeiense TaxID=595255 RepID=A0A9P5HKA8_9HYPO|nr:hypothetical protein G7Z17_g2179 [Cylindrodendrum hubeiense]
MDTKPQSSWRSLFTYSFVVVLSLLLLIYGGPSRNPNLKSHALVTERNFHHNVATNLTKRETVTYDDAREKGAKLHCLMGMSQADAEAANQGVSLESPEYLQAYYLGELEGWSSEVDPDAPYFRDYLDAAFSGLRIAKKLHSELWIHTKGSEIWDDPFDPDEGDPTEIQASEASFGNSFQIDAGMVIADRNFGVNEAMKKKFGSDWKAQQIPTTHLRQWSDAAWMQWDWACADNGGDNSKVKYIVRSWITNEFTLRVIFQALIDKNNRDGKGTTIGKWNNRVTLTEKDHPDQFHAILGSPNGAGTAFFLINHKEKLGIKTIDKVDIFVPNIPYTVVGTSVSEFEKLVKIMLLFYVTDV